jgi:hypothetical protein
MSDHVSSSPVQTPRSGNNGNSTTNPNLSTRIDPTNHLNTAVDATNKSVCIKYIFCIFQLT